LNEYNNRIVSGNIGAINDDMETHTSRVCSPLVSCFSKMSSKKYEKFHESNALAEISRRLRAENLDIARGNETKDGQLGMCDAEDSKNDVQPLVGIGRGGSAGDDNSSSSTSTSTSTTSSSSSSSSISGVRDDTGSDASENSSASSSSSEDSASTEASEDDVLACASKDSKATSSWEGGDGDRNNRKIEKEMTYDRATPSQDAVGDVPTLRESDELGDQQALDLEPLIEFRLVAADEHDGGNLASTLVVEELEQSATQERNDMTSVTDAIRFILSR
jgi:hypothetical protein